jgi:hypothetical protein
VEPEIAMGYVSLVSTINPGLCQKYPMVSEILSFHLNCYNLMFTPNKSSIRFKCFLMPLLI